MRLPRRITTRRRGADLARFPALAGVPHKVLADVATWADELTVQPGEAVGGLGVNRWSYLVADPLAIVEEDGQCRPAGDAIGLVGAMRQGLAPESATVVAREPLELLAIPPTRLPHLVEQVPRLIRIAFEQTAPIPTETQPEQVRSIC